MTLRAGEYSIDGDKITIPKKVLEKIRDNYKSISEMSRLSGRHEQSLIYLGKTEVFMELLKMFEPLEEE